MAPSRLKHIYSVKFDLKNEQDFENKENWLVHEIPISSKNLFHLMVIT